MKRHTESALAFRQASASYQQNGMLQFQALSMQNAMAAEQAGAATLLAPMRQPCQHAKTYQFAMHGAMPRRRAM